MGAAGTGWVPGGLWLAGALLGAVSVPVDPGERGEPPSKSTFFLSWLLGTGEDLGFSWTGMGTGTGLGTGMLHFPMGLDQSSRQVE